MSRARLDRMLERSSQFFAIVRMDQPDVFFATGNSLVGMTIGQQEGFFDDEDRRVVVRPLEFEPHPAQARRDLLVGEIDADQPPVGREQSTPATARNGLAGDFDGDGKVTTDFGSSDYAKIGRASCRERV